jgi:hypothetical protein
MNDNKIKETNFQIDFLPGRTFPGFSMDKYWNGFDCPYFTFEQAQNLATVWRETGKSTSYFENEDVFVFEPVDGSEESELFAAELINGKKFYPIGAGWIWSEVEASE